MGACSQQRLVPDRSSSNQFLVVLARVCVWQFSTALWERLRQPTQRHAKLTCSPDHQAQQQRSGQARAKQQPCEQRHEPSVAQGRCRSCPVGHSSANSDSDSRSNAIQREDFNACRTRLWVRGTSEFASCLRCRLSRAFPALACRPVAVFVAADSWRVFMSVSRWCGLLNGESASADHYWCSQSLSSSACSSSSARMPSSRRRVLGSLSAMS